MAIEITPKKKIKIPLWAIIVGGFELLVLLCLIGSYFYFHLSLNRISREIEDKEPIVIPLEKLIKEKEDELVPIGSKIDYFNDLLSKHKTPLNILSFLEKICLQNVWFSEFNFSSEGRVTVNGKTDNFATLEHQVAVLNEEPLLKGLRLSQVSMEEEGGINFALELIFDPLILRQ